MSYKTKSRKRKGIFQRKHDFIEWTEDEVQVLLDTIKEHGHLNVIEIQKALPSKTLSEYQSFLRRVKRHAMTCKGEPKGNAKNLMYWIENCKAEYSKKGVARTGSLELAVMLQLLSIDGVLENHPLPEDADGVDYAACYRVLYQAILGHPIQPVNKETADALYSAIAKMIVTAELSNEIKQELSNFVEQKFNLKPVSVPEDSVSDLYHVDLPKKPVKSYGRKKPEETTKPKETEEDIIVKDILLNPLQLPKRLLFDLKVKPGFKANQATTTSDGLSSSTTLYKV